jgi:nucleoside-diphosphate-sugar epimerase
VALTYVSDVVKAIECALKAPLRCDFPVYAITGPETPVLWDVIRTLLEALNIQVNLRPIPEWIAAKAANVLEVWGDISKREPKLTRYTVALLARHQTYDISRARHDLGYEPKVFVAQGLSETIKELDL